MECLRGYKHNINSRELLGLLGDHKKPQKPLIRVKHEIRLENNKNALLRPKGRNLT